MQPMTRGSYRVHFRRDDSEKGSGTEGGHSSDGASGKDSRTAPTEFVLVELPEEPVAPDDPAAEDAYEPIRVQGIATDGDSDDVDLAAIVGSLEPGDVIDATLAWGTETTQFVDVAIDRRSRFHYADDVEGMFEAALDTWNRAKRAGDAFASEVTHSTDGEPNGALYIFADPPGRDLFEEVQAGHVPIEPLVARVNEAHEPGPRAVFVLRPTAHAFLAVYVVFEVDGLLARTIRDTYDIDGATSGLEGAVDDGAGRGGSGDHDDEWQLGREENAGTDDAEPASLADLDVDLDGDSTRNL